MMDDKFSIFVLMVALSVSALISLNGWERPAPPTRRSRNFRRALTQWLVGWPGGGSIRPRELRLLLGEARNRAAETGQEGAP
jgi:hypothetical protein